MKEVGGDMQNPELWVGIPLVAIRERECCMDIVQRIGPLARCMSADTARVFFKSSHHWKNALVLFVDLILNLVSIGRTDGRTSSYSVADKENKRVMNTLFRHNEGLLSSIVQWGFWGEEYRPDIANLFGVEDCKLVAAKGSSITQLLLADALERHDESNMFCLTNNGMNLVRSVGSTSIISKDYDPECMVSYVENYIRYVKAAGVTTSREYRRYEITIRILVEDAQCIDRGVINQLIDLGSGMTEFNMAEFMVKTSFTLLFKFKQEVEGQYQQSDSRIATAVRAGLIEMCLGYIEQFETHESFGVIQSDHDRSMKDYIEDIFIAIHLISFHQKSWKAIRHKRCCIEQELLRLEKKIDVKCKRPLDLVRSILNLNGSYCCHCNKSLGRTEVKLCNGCHRMTYCSEACQKEDWLNGHNVTCCSSPTTENIGQFQGRIQPETLPDEDSVKLKDLEININMIQLKLFLDNSKTILRQADSLGIPLCDCIVNFDLSQCPLGVTTHEYTHYYNDPEMKKGFENTRSKDNITCFYTSFIACTDTFLSHQKFFPHDWLSKQSGKEGSAT